MKMVMDILFFSSIAVYFLATVSQFAGAMFKKTGLLKAAWYGSLLGFVLLTASIICRGVAAGYVPLANQFEFAAAFGWGIGLLNILLRVRLKEEWISTVSLPTVFLVISYAALLPRDINELMPALRSAWFSFHIGAAVFSYASFAVAGGMGVKYLVQAKKNPEDSQLEALDYISYRLVAFGFLMLTVVILTGCVWAEQAWSSFWSWDPKETWALITWIIYAIYLHQRMRKGWQGKRMAIFAIIALVSVIFTFVGVNTLMSGLHSYA